MGALEPSSKLCISTTNFSTTFYHHMVSRPLLEANAQKVKLSPFNGSLAETIM